MRTRRRFLVENLPILVLQERDAYVAYTPALDLSTCGDTFEEALKRFHEAAALYLQECVRHGTLDEALESYGWHKVPKPSPHWVPPRVVGHVEQPISVPMTS